MLQTRFSLENTGFGGEEMRFHPSDRCVCYSRLSVYVRGVYIREVAVLVASKFVNK